MTGAADVEPIPGNGRLFHIGPPKTGTTALQWAASEARAELLANGVRYPGRSRNHRLAVSAFLGRGMGWDEGGGPPSAPPLRHWYELLGELQSERTRRCWFGHEYAAAATADDIARFTAQLGPRLHVVITLRSYARMLPSMWQERLKAGGSSRAFEPWLRSMLRPRRPAQVERQRRHDHAALVERWVQGLGPDRVTVVVLDPDDHGFAFAAFERLLDLPPGTLDARQPGRANRSLSMPEAELLRRLNRETREHRLPWTSHERLVVQGVVARLLADGPAGGEPVRLPGWAAAAANEVAARNAERIQASGVRLVGDPANLAAPAVARPKGPATPEAVSVETATAALTGLLAAANGYDADFGRSAERAGRQVLLHAAADLRALREVGPAALLRTAAERSRGALAGMALAARGWASAKSADTE